MDARSRPPYAPAPPLHPPPPHHSPLDPRPPPPAFSPAPYPPPHQAYPPPPPPPGATGNVLPPINAYQAAPGAPPDHHQQQQQQQQHLPPFRHSHDAVPRDAAPPPPPNPDYHAYHQHTHSGHVTPAPATRSYSVDSAHQQRTPTTPAQPSHYTPSSAPDGSTPHHPMEHSAHYAYPATNGVPAHGLPAPPPHEQPHGYATPVMEAQHGYGPPPPQAMPYSQNYGPVSANIMSVQKRKQMRATQACEQCRQRKQKCDEGNPCSFCKEQNLSCQYRDTPPAKTDKNMERVLQTLDNIGPMLADISTKMEEIDERLRGLETARTMQVANNQQPDDEPNIVVPKRKPELDDHRTAPHKLIMLWPTVRALLLDAKVDYGGSYVVEAEDRGILRIYTRGEGIDEAEGTQHGAPASPARSEDSSEASVPSPPDGLWGTGFPNTLSSDVKRAEPLCEGGLKPDGSLDLDMATINKLYESYMKTFHRMHPFLDKSRLRKLFDRFIHRYSTGHPTVRKFAVDNGSDQERPMKRQRSNGATAIGIPGSEPFSARREPTERSPGNAIIWLVLALGKIALHKGPLPGAVPDHRANASTNSSFNHSHTTNGFTGSSPVAAIKPSPISPKATPFTQPTPPGADGFARPDMRSRRSSIDSHPGARNLDIIPGLAYYGKAAEILGDQGDGNDLVHAQMFLLAGLYKGQLARVKESMSWISMAGRAIIMLLDRYKLYNEQYWTAYGDARKQYEKGQARIKDKRHSLIVLASWTCLQLESDILADMKLPSSGILTMEEMLLLPLNMPEEDKESYEGLLQQPSQESNDKESYDTLLIYYSAQLYMRRRLNRMHQEMYGDQCLNQTLPEVREMLIQHEETLGYWRDQLTRSMAWHDDDPPASDILNARLRAKYWGARYLSNRPFLDFALHIMPQLEEGREIEDVATDVYGNPRDPAEVHLFKAIAKMDGSDIWRAAARCVDSAMHSTVAFDGIDDRLIVTNIHGTAHAQFGNMLVLSATYHNAGLTKLVDPEKYRALLERTIRFLRKLSHISPTCGHDCQILEKISECHFNTIPAESSRHHRIEDYQSRSATSSFNNSM